MIMIMIIFGQEVPITGVVFREILKKKLWSSGPLGDALTTCKSLSWSQKTHSYKTAGFIPLRGAKRA